MKTLEFDRLNKKDLFKNNNQVIQVNKDNIDFYIKLNLKENNDKLIVFSNGAYDPNKSKPPIFMRSKWYEDFNANCLYIDDRTVHNNKLRIGWGVGSADRHYLKDYAYIAQKVATQLNIQPENVIYLGSSAGGFMSMHMATMHKGSSAIVNNPQCYVDRYDTINVNRLYKTIFPELSRDEIKKKYALRLSLTSLFRSKKYVPNVYYIQNRLCETDMENHYTPFCEYLDKYEIDSSSIKFILYNNKALGHGPITKQQTVEFTNQILAGTEVIGTL